jgi:predicted nucleic acid-binding protein
MLEVFADTAGWANFFVRTEPFHLQAKNLMQQWHANGAKIVTTNYVLLELIALLNSPLRLLRVEQIRTIETIKNSSWVEIFHINPSIDELAWELLRTREDKRWSLVDCSSFEVMRQRKITQAFTSDHHFEQAGFLSMLR